MAAAPAAPNQVPAEHALGANGKVLAIGSGQFEEEGEVIVPDVGMDEDLALAIHEADVHLAGMEVDSAIELCGGGVILHDDHSWWLARASVKTIGYAGKWWCTFPPDLPDGIKKPKGLGWKYQFARPNAEERGHVLLAIDAWLPRSSASVSLPFATRALHRPLKRVWFRHDNDRPAADVA
jgi:hypothetical protein